MSELPPFIEVFQKYGWSGFPLLQSADTETVTSTIANNLQMAGGVHKFLSLFNGDTTSGSENAEFLRGLLVGAVTVIMLENDQSKMDSAMDQFMMMVAIMNAKRIDILTGSDLDEEQIKRRKVINRES